MTDPLAFVLESIPGWLSSGAGFPVRFARPWGLALLALIPVWLLLGAWCRRRRSADWAALGQPRTLAALTTAPARAAGWARSAWLLAWALLTVGLAGPRWGTMADGVAVGRDIVIVLDLSRSMLADDMTDAPHGRAEAARQALLAWLDDLSRRGGHRLALVVFAAKPVVLSPLTTDYDHIRSVLESLDVRHPPLACRPGLDPQAVSGTRIGAALAEAVALHDTRFTGSQDILLLTDGDDPLGDEEWRIGINAARAAHIPVHVVGLGNPQQESPIPWNGDWLHFIPPDVGLPVPVRTRLHEEPLIAIAEQTGGQYLPARQARPELIPFYRTQIEPFPSRQLTDDELPQPRDRSLLFLAAALLLFTFAWLQGE